MDKLRKTAILLLMAGSVSIAWPQQSGSPVVVDTSSPGQSLDLPSAEPPVKITPTSETREGLIHLDVAARDQQGRALGNLTAMDLTLQQDGAATMILSFHPSNRTSEDESLSEACLVLDEVDLTPIQFTFIKRATINYLRRNDGVLPQPVSILWVKADGVYTSAFPTTDGNKLAQDIDSGHVFLSDWKFHPEQQPSVTRKLDADHPGAILQTNVTLRDILADEVLRTVYTLALKWRNKPGRKALLWMGYGWSILNKLYVKSGPFSLLVELSTRIREARMVIYDISPWPDPEFVGEFKILDYHRFLPGVRSSSDPGLKSPVPYFALPVLAAQSGGLVLDNSKDMEGDIGRCITDASDFYSISFDPPRDAQPDEYHDLSVLIGPEQSPARTMRGYYNQPVFYDQPRVPEKRLSVMEIEQLLETDHGEHDRELAGNLNSLELTERLSSVLLAVWKQRLHGKQSKSALTALGDQSVFLAPPAMEIADQPAPDEDMQHHIILRAEKYLNDVVPRLPDFSADATTLKYEQHSTDPDDTWKTAAPNRGLAQTTSEKESLLYRNGREQRVVEKQASMRNWEQNVLSYRGIFGPILKLLLEDVQRSNSRLNWSRWEKSGQTKLAVFSYSVQTEKRYGLIDCCLVDGHLFDTEPERHGELAIDPDTGTILRITTESGPGWIRETDLSPVQPVMFSNMLVEYGPVEIGGRSFICPKRSVVIARERTVRFVSVWGETFKVYGPYQTLMNDTAYTNYHKFGSDSQLLPGFVVQDKTTH